jgi:hypothetical protein
VGVEGALSLLQRLQLASKAGQVFRREAHPRADFSGEPERAALPMSDEQCTDAYATAGGCGESADDEFLALGAFALQPSVVPARTIGLVTSLADDPFAPELADARQQYTAIDIEMLRISNGR